MNTNEILELAMLVKAELESKHGLRKTHGEDFLFAMMFCMQDIPEHELNVDKFANKMSEFLKDLKQNKSHEIVDVLRLPSPEDYIVAAMLKVELVKNFGFSPSELTRRDFMQIMFDCAHHWAKEAIRSGFAPIMAEVLRGEREMPSEPQI